MNLATTIELYAGGQGSGCHGENCGRPKLASDKQEEKADTLLKEHDQIKGHPRREAMWGVEKRRMASEFQWQSITKWQQGALQQLMDHITDASHHKDVLSKVREASKKLDDAEHEAYKETPNYKMASVHQENALEYLHEAITEMQRNLSTVHAGKWRWVN